VEARSRNFDVAALLGRIIAIIAFVALAAWLVGIAVVTVRIIRRRRAIGRTP
jgi:flagellar biogenesis protein FliO